MDNKEITSAFPFPPFFYKEYTKKKYDKLKAFMKSNADGDKEPPKGIEHLLPPKCPEGNQYKVFNQVWNLREDMPHLKEMGVMQLYDEGKKPKEELTRLNRSILKQFQILTRGLAEQTLDNEGISKITNDLHLTFINMHHLTNLSRPNQAKETLKIIYKERSKRFRDANAFAIETKRKILKDIMSVDKMIEEKRGPFKNTEEIAKASETVVKSEPKERVEIETLSAEEKKKLAKEEKLKLQREKITKMKFVDEPYLDKLENRKDSSTYSLEKIV